MEPEAVFKAMADRTRQRTLAVLRRYELSVSELVETLQQPQSTISRHLKVLRDAGLICDRRHGNTVLYCVPQPNGNGDREDLRSRMLEWLADQPLAESVETRLQRIIRKRRDMSSRFFDRIGRQWDTLREESFGSRFHLEALFALLPRDWVVADVGTGTGYLLPTLSRHFHRVIAVDPVENMLAAARHRVEDAGTANVDLRRGDLASLPIRDATIDLALAMLVVHHVPTPREALSELFRIIRKEGRVLIVEQTAHHNESFRERMQDRWWGFDPGEFVDLLRSVGFNDVTATSLVNVDRGDDAPDLFVVTAVKTHAAAEDRA